MKTINGINFPLSFEIVPNKGNFLFVKEKTIIRLMFWDEIVFKTINPDLTNYSIIKLR